MVWGPPLLILLIGTHLFLAVRLRFIQRFIGKVIKLSFERNREGEGDVSHFRFRRLKTVWSFADITNGLMALPNLISLIVLNKVIVSETASISGTRGYEAPHQRGMRRLRPRFGENVHPSPSPLPHGQ